jgi:nucleotide-binding universal stress UspA family protein
MSTFLIGVDGSKAAAQALSWACGLAEFLASDRLIIATVYVADPTDTSSWDQATIGRASASSSGANRHATTVSRTKPSCSTASQVLPLSPWPPNTTAN